MKSISLFLTISIISIIVLANFLAATHGYQESMADAEKLFDSKLVNVADILAVSSFNASTENSTSNLDDSLLFQVRNQRDDLLFQSPIFNSKNTFKISAIEQKSYTNFNGFRWRLISKFYTHQERWVHVLEKQNVRYKLAESVILKSVYPIILAVPTIAFLIFFIIRRGLNPIFQLAEEVNNKTASNLSTIHLNDVPNELSQLTIRINDLLYRLDSSLLREKRFASDAAHELRTPIAALNIQMKNLIDENKNVLSSQASVKELSEGVKRMSHLVEQILILNRMSPELYVDQFEKLNVIQLLKQVISEVYPLVEDKSHEIELVLSKWVETNYSDQFVLGDEFALQTLFKNLLVNAIKYTPNNGLIRVEVSDLETGLSIQVMDSGKGIKESERTRIFERFYRIDGDRNRSDVSGCGLGLSIVKQIADLHQIEISLSKSAFKCGNEIFDSGLNVELVFNKNNTINE